MSAVRILEEDWPDPEVLEQIEAVEEDPDLCGMDLEVYACWLRSLLPDRVHGYAPSLPVSKSCPYMPGSRKKIRVMRERAEQGMGLFHPDDAAVGE